MRHGFDAGRTAHRGAQGTRGRVQGGASHRVEANRRLESTARKILLVYCARREMNHLAGLLADQGKPTARFQLCRQTLAPRLTSRRSASSFSAGQYISESTTRTTHFALRITAGAGELGSKSASNGDPVSQAIYRATVDRAEHELLPSGSDDSLKLITGSLPRRLAPPPQSFDIRAHAVGDPGRARGSERHPAHSAAGTAVDGRSSRHLAG